MSKNPNDTAATLRALRGIVAHKQHGHVQGVTVDLFTASAILKVHDALNPANQQKLLRLAPLKMATVAFKLLKS